MISVPRLIGLGLVGLYVALRAKQATMVRADRHAEIAENVYLQRTIFQ